MAVWEIEEIFSDILDRAKSLDPVNTRQWFDKLNVAQLDGGSLVISCPDDSTVQFLRANCQTSFLRSAQQITGHLVTVDFVVDDKNQTNLSFDQPDENIGFKQNPDYTFDNFVVGPSNRLAHASCIAISQSPGNTYNPLFLYGSSGLGKTHLLHAVCCETRNRFNGAVIQFLSCEDFVNRFIHAIEQGNLAGFQSQFRTVDTLVIDDVQFLSEREQSQTEFFHTFNALYNSGKQILLSADCAPNEIPSLEQRLISRFSWGLVARVDPPTYETRAAIVQKKAHLRGLEISEEISEYIAKKVCTNIRELEGALTTIYAVAMTSNAPITLELAKLALDGQVSIATRHISITDIINVVTKYFDVRLTDLQSKKRSQSITMPRQICMYLARNLTKHSLEEIGGHLGGRDHTTVMHACNKIAEIEKTDEKVKNMLSDLAKKITESNPTN